MTREEQIEVITQVFNELSQLQTVRCGLFDLQDLKQFAAEYGVEVEDECERKTY